MPPVPPCTPRAKNAATTREAILRAATDCFVQESYESVGLRDIAARAGVDVALVNRYFGAKKNLFVDVLRGCPPEEPPPLNAEDLPHYFADQTAGGHCPHDQADVDRLLIILRSASSPEAAEIARSTVRDDLLMPFAALLPGADAGARASLGMAVWIGTIILRDIMALEPLASADPELVRRKLVRLFETALAAD